MNKGKFSPERMRQKTRLDQMIDQASRVPFDTREDFIEFAKSDAVLEAVFGYAAIMAKARYRRSDKFEVCQEIANEIFVEYCAAIDRRAATRGQGESCANQFEALKFAKTIVVNQAGYLAAKAANQTTVGEVKPTEEEKKQGIRPNVQVSSISSIGEAYHREVENALLETSSGSLSAEGEILKTETAKEVRHVLCSIFKSELKLDKVSTKAAFRYLLMDLSANERKYGQKKRIAEMHGISIERLNNRLDGMKERSQRDLPNFFRNEMADGWGK